jgi:hypothetical protein
MLGWGPALDAEIEHRRERLGRLWGRPEWADRIAGSLEHRRVARTAHGRTGQSRRGVAGVGETRRVALR